MESSHNDFLELDVPIRVDLGIGKNWDDAH